MIKRNTLICILSLVLIISAIYGQTWVTLQSGFNDSTFLVTVISSDYDSTVIDIDIPGFYYEDTTVGGATYKKLTLPGPTLFYSDTLTHPRLPKIHLPIAIPGTKGISISVVDSAETTFADWSIYPSAHVFDSVSSDSLGNIDSAYISCFEIDSSFYQGTGTYPDSNVSRSYPYIVNGARGVNLVFIPFKYSKGDTSLKAISNYRIKLTYSGTDSTNCLDTDTFTVSPSDTQGLAMLFCNFRSFSLLEPEDFESSLGTATSC